MRLCSVQRFFVCGIEQCCCLWVMCLIKRPPQQLCLSIYRPRRYSCKVHVLPFRNPQAKYPRRRKSFVIFQSGLKHLEVHILIQSLEFYILFISVNTPGKVTYIPLQLFLRFSGCFIRSRSRKGLFLL